MWRPVVAFLRYIIRVPFLYDISNPHTYGSPLSSKRACSFSKASMPSRIESSDLEMCASCELGSRLSDMARCRSRSDSLI